MDDLELGSMGLDGEEDPNAAKDFNAASFFGTVSDVIARYSHCNDCGGHLHFTHFTDFSRNMTQECSRCPECNQQSKKILHRLQ